MIICSMDDDLARIKRFVKLAFALDGPRECSLMLIKQVLAELPPPLILLLSSRTLRYPALIPSSKTSLFPPLRVALGSAPTTVDEKLGTPFDSLDRIRVREIFLSVLAN